MEEEMFLADHARWKLWRHTQDSLVEQSAFGTKKVVSANIIETRKPMVDSDISSQHLVHMLVPMPKGVLLRKLTTWQLQFPKKRQCNAFGTIKFIAFIAAISEEFKEKFNLRYGKP